MKKLNLKQSTKYKFDREELTKLKNNIKKEKLQRNTERLWSLIIDLPINEIRLNEINQEKGASTSLSTLPIIKKDTVYQNENFGIS